MREHILSEIRRLAAANGGRAPGQIAFSRETGIREHEWRGVYWARWGDALVAAGFEPNDKNRKLDSSFVLGKLADAARHYGKIPTVAELKMYRRLDEATPGEKTFERHFNGRAEMLAEFRMWLATAPGYEDVAAMLPDEPGAPPAGRHEAAAEGFVYLIRSGAHYKIGRSDELERRVKQIRVALPEAATMVHAIRTDDPAGIEAYWHRRFGDKRANGEWFKLTAADVAAFKRRKYQ
jgi:hypothetical protein